METSDGLIAGPGRTRVIPGETVTSAILPLLEDPASVRHPANLAASSSRATATRWRNGAFRAYDPSSPALRSSPQSVVSPFNFENRSSAHPQWPEVASLLRRFPIISNKQADQNQPFRPHRIEKGIYMNDEE